MDKATSSARPAADLDALLATHYPHGEPIAVIGHACRFPEADDSDAFWRNLLAGAECSRRFTRQEMLDAGLDAATIDAPNFVNVGTVVRDADAFDAALFGHSRQEAESIDPQQRLFLQIVWHALEHAGYAPRNVAHRTGVFGSARVSTYPGQEPLRIAEVAQVKGLQSLMGNDKDYVATRVAYKLNLRGPALAVQTACSSSLVAAHLACESLRSGECDMAVAGGVAVSFPQHAGYLHQPGMIFSPDGRCRPFDADAQGTFAGNGVGAIVLRRLGDALRDGDPVVAVLLGSAINNDGDRKVGYTAPSAAGQRDAIRDALMLAGVDSTQIGLVEAHGTGTPLGDPIELEALRGVFHRADEGPRCALGSVKGNVGHLDTAAGIASLLKAVLAVERRAIPPSLHLRKPNPALGLDDSPFFVPTDAQPWNDASRVAGVSSFGIGGTNCHMVVASLPDALRAAVGGNGDGNGNGNGDIDCNGDGKTESEGESESESESDDSHAQPDAGAALLLSAASEPALQRLARSYADALKRANARDLLHTALHGRQLDLPHRLAVPFCTETIAALDAFAAGEDDALVHRGSGEAGQMAWLFTGQGSHWPGMGQTLYRQSSAFAACLDRCFAACDGELDVPLRDAMFGERGDLLERMDYAQPAIVAFELAMAAHWRALGLEPQLVIGHSVGEYAAAVVAGHYEIEQAMPLVRLRGALMQRCAQGAMLAAFAGADALLPLAACAGVDVAAYNDERHLVFSGRSDAIDTLAADLVARNIRHARLAVTGAAHSALLDPVLDAFERATAQLNAAPGRVPLVSTLLGGPIDAHGLNARDYWRRHMREPVRYADAIRHALAQGANVFLELGPDAQLTGIGLRGAQPGARWIASARRRQPALAQTRQALLELYAAGVALPWAKVLPSSGRKLHAPRYPFDTERYWRDARPAAAAAPPAAHGGDFDLALAEGRRIAATAATSLDLPRLQRLYDCVTQLHAIYVDRLVRRCVGERFDEGASALGILRAGRLLPRHRQLLVRLLNACVEDGYYRRDGDRYAPALAVPHADRDALLQILRECCEGFDAIADTVARAGDSLYAMMRGDIEPIAVIFPDSASSGVEVLYQEFSFGRYFNQIAAGVVAGLVRERQAGRRAHRPFRILEVGGGTGGTTAWLLPELDGAPNVRYDFTDISPIFTRRAEQKFAAHGCVDYRVFDLQKDAQTQGFEAGAYDLIVAANVIHATQHVGRTLANLAPLLKPGGRLLMREITRPMRLFDFVFGPLVLPLHDEDARGGELFLSTARWKAQCVEAGFERVDWLPDDGAPTSGISEHIVLASMPGRPASAASWLDEDADPLVGQPLTDDGVYLADWSDCAGERDAWRQRLARSAAELAARHGGGRAAPAIRAPECAPAWLTLVRLRWCGSLFGAARIALDARDEAGAWRPLDADANADSGHGHSGSDARDLPAPQPARDTHYGWRWRPVPDASPDASDIALHAESAPLADTLRAAGVPVSPSAECRLLVLDSDAHSPHEVAAALLDALSDASRAPLVVVTRGAWKIRADDPVAPAHRAAWGLLRVAAAEQPDRMLAAIDLHPHAAWRDLPPALGALGALGHGARWLAVRDGRVHAPSLAAQPYAAPALPAGGFADERWHVVTGAFGGLGRLSVRWLARHGARRIALVAPRAHDDWPAFQREIAAQHRGELRWVRCDVAEPAQLAAALHALHADGGVAGAIHAAGILDDAPLAALDAERVAPVLALKADAARVLRDWLGAHGARYLVCYSSAAAALGAPGQGAHALASAYLDGLADAHAGDETPSVISVAWGAWGEAGRAAQSALQRKLAENGMGVLSTAEGLWHLEQAVMRGAPYRLAMRVLHERLDAGRRALFGTDADQSPARLARNPAAGVSAESCAPAAAGATLAAERPDPRDVEAVCRWLTARIAAQLKLDDLAQLTPTRDLLKLGLDSLLFLELRSAVESQLGVRLDAERAYRDMTVAGIGRLIAESAPAGAGAPDPAAGILVHDPANRFEPFPLTPIQHAYWLGRTDLIAYGGVACHVLFEWDMRHDTFDLARFEAAWNALVARHDMLRMIVDADGRQRILRDVPAYRPQRRDLTRAAADEQARALERTRDELSYRVLPADRWPLFELVVTELDDTRYRLHMNLDLLLFDVQSFKVMMDDLASAYRGAALEPLQITFRDYVLAEHARRDAPDWQASWRYWQRTLPQLPPAPVLPLAPARADDARPRFTTYQARLARADWDTLKREWQRWGATPSAALLALFAHTLERWSRHPDFTLNLTFFNRRPDHPQVSQLIGDFTSVLLIDFALGGGPTLRDTIERTQQRLWQRLAHSQVNGIELMRELSRGRAHDPRRPLMPVVFTSMLGMSLDGLSIDQAMTSLFGEPVHVFTQTPQVWLDHQVMEVDGDLVFSWYCMDDVLAPGAAQAMFDDYRCLLRGAAAQPERMMQPGLAKLRDDGAWADFERRRWPLHVGNAGDSEDPVDTGVDLRDIEDALRAQHGVADADAALAEDGRTLDIVVCAAHACGAPPPSLDAPLALASALPMLDAAQLAEIDATWRWLEARALHGIARTLNRHGLFAQAGQRHDLDDVQSRLRALPQYRRLARQWLIALAERGWLRREGDAFICERALDAVPDAAEALPQADWSRALGAYLDACIARHDALFDGTQAPLALLFDDDDAVTRALYSDNPAIDCLNRSAAQIARALGEPAGGLRVLEVGAGTAATTRHLVPALDGRLHGYRFTDVSTLFLDAARERFADHAKLDYAIFDINAPVDFDAHPEAGYDVVVAVNVLHDASDVVRSLRRLGRLLKPGGRLLMIEATERDSALQMASIGFIEGLNGYEDFRTADDKPMLDLPSWRDALGQAGFTVELAWPEQERSPLRQHLVLARATHVGRLEPRALERELRARFGRALPPARIRQCERIDRYADRVAERHREAADETPARAARAPVAPPRDPHAQAALERSVGEAWQALLKCPIHRDSDFFQSGGDSLIATRMIAQLNRGGMRGASLQALFAQPTLGAFCATLTAPPATEAQAGDCVVPLAEGRDPARVFVFHASDGELAAYVTLARRLDCRVHGLRAPDAALPADLGALAGRYVQAMRASQPHGPYTLIGWSYGATVAAEAARLLHARGETVELVLLDPVCRDDFRHADRASLLRLLARGRVAVPLPDDLEQRDADEQTACFVHAAQAAGLLPERSNAADGERWLARIGDLLGLLARHPAPAPLPIRCLWIAAAHRPSVWQPAERDWHGWGAHAQRHTLDADHWTLVMDDARAQHVAALFRQWRDDHRRPQEKVA
ncbi:type I polyketide synthase [Burkholderia sp. MSMB1498]|uniref:type I polyketide synthase n=1 Tax=Burkholderia sp. MSMB1498 TaxID=1637842 RepID=UPI000751C76D|nr:type I polyketide synthase [Burkholderia sp. MSMB1498]KVK87314.1 polyketide synthase [Burkholderia sp. MSMB1498]